jgi:hypothetical protein
MVTRADPEQGMPATPQAAAPEATVADYEAAALRLMDRLFGVTLFFACLEILSEGQPQLTETYRRQCRNLTQRGYAALDHAEQRLQQHSADPAVALDAAALTLCDAPGENGAAEMFARADALMGAYQALFPGRERSAALERDDLFRLMETAALQWQGA